MILVYHTQGDLDDNLSVEADGSTSDSLLTLAEWSDEKKAGKLAMVKNSLAKNLLEQILVGDPMKRAPLCRILAHPFLSDKKPKRLIGELTVILLSESIVIMIQ